MHLHLSKDSSIKALAGLRDHICNAYLDDILVYGKSFSEHMTNLKKVFNRLMMLGVKLSARKCMFVKEEVRYLGRLISQKGSRPDPKGSRVLFYVSMLCVCCIMLVQLRQKF